VKSSRVLAAWKLGRPRCGCGRNTIAIKVLRRPGGRVCTLFVALPPPSYLCPVNVAVRSRPTRRNPLSGSIWLVGKHLPGRRARIYRVIQTADKSVH